MGCILSMTTLTSTQLWNMVLCHNEAPETGHQITGVSSYAGVYEDGTKRQKKTFQLQTSSHHSSSYRLPFYQARTISKQTGYHFSVKQSSLKASTSCGACPDFKKTWGKV